MDQAPFPIRQATESNWEVLRMLLPSAIHYGTDARSWVATTDDGRLIIGAAVISGRLRVEPVPGVRVDLHVVPPYRRRGVGRNLLVRCAAAASEQGAALYSWHPIRPDSPEMAGYRWLGFDRSVKVFEGRGRFDSAKYAALKKMFDELAERKWIPAQARIVPLAPEFADELAAMHVEYLGGNYQSILRRLRGEMPPRYDPRLSPVLLLEGRVVGFTLARIVSRGVALIDATVVMPSLRRGWANLWLKVAGANACQDMGIDTLLFYSYEHHTDTRKFARQRGAAIVELVEPYQLLPIATAGSLQPEPPGVQRPGPL